MSESTPTGIPIEDCETCGRRHPVTRSHCVDCGIGSAFLDPDAGMCLTCLNGPLPARTVSAAGDGDAGRDTGFATPGTTGLEDEG